MQWHIWKSCYFILNVHVNGYVQSYCVNYNLTHEHKSTQWGGSSSYVEDHHQKVHHSYFKEFQEVPIPLVQDQSITTSPALTAFQSACMSIVQCHNHARTHYLAADTSETIKLSSVVVSNLWTSSKFSNSSYIFVGHAEA